VYIYLPITAGVVSVIVLNEVDRVFPTGGWRSWQTICKEILGVTQCPTSNEINHTSVGTAAKIYLSSNISSM